jgi:hypothetical protein
MERSGNVNRNRNRPNVANVASFQVHSSMPVSLTIRVWLRLAFVVVVVVPGGACSERLVPDSMLVGTWTVSSESRELLPADAGSRSIALTLRDDGTLSATDLPGELVVEENSRRDRYLSGAGKWFREDQYDDQRIALVLEAIDQPHKVRLPYQAVMWATATSGRPRLYYYRGDPDQRIIVWFDKVDR